MCLTLTSSRLFFFFYSLLISREIISTKQQIFQDVIQCFLFWMGAPWWHNSYTRIFCPWQIKNCFVSEINKTSCCFEITCFGYWRVYWSGGWGEFVLCLLVERGAPEKPRKAVTLKCFSSHQGVICCCCSRSRRELGIGASWDFSPR